MRRGKVINFDGFHSEIKHNTEGTTEKIINYKVEILVFRLFDEGTENVLLRKKGSEVPLHSGCSLSVLLL